MRKNPPIIPIPVINPKSLNSDDCIGSDVGNTNLVVVADDVDDDIDVDADIDVDDVKEASVALASLVTLMCKYTFSN
jgi:hypothetical protein